MTPQLPLLLLISATLFCIGLMAALSRRSAIFILIGIEIMLAAANLNFIAFWRYSPHPSLRVPVKPLLDTDPGLIGLGHSLPSPHPTGVMFALFSIAIAAAEAAVGLAFVIAVYRHTRTTQVSKLDQLKG